MARRKFKTVDLFSGAGGLSAGFRATGLFESVFAVEIDRSAAHTYALNFGHTVITEDNNHIVDVTDPRVVYNGDILKLGNLGFQADIVIGGPPCQGFSPLGKISPTKKHLLMNQLWQAYMRLVSQVKPLAFVIENVPEILRSKEALAITTLANRLGYRVSSGELRAVEFGVPQRRIRAFIIGILGDVSPQLPQANRVRRVVQDAIGDLPLYPETTQLGEPTDTGTGIMQNLHFGRNPTELSLRRYRLIPPGGNRFDLMRQAPEITPRCWLEKPTGSTDVFGRLQWDRPAYTIRTEFFKPEKGCYLHPEAHRPITHREAARLQTFDDSFIFSGSKIEIARQIGNAVPPQLAQAVAKTLGMQLRETAKTNTVNRDSVPGPTFRAMLVDVIAEVFGTTGIFHSDDIPEGTLGQITLTPAY